ncbi:acyloxyacyl hydrolase [Thiobacillus sedimenti]|uniref:Lipid A deacylase n=1 Tax=Thiobacillus sedimenti TaxID=3110231 RepID=A0ABZ1CHN8_9PROT|nr:acyloxyacyl hydrolase [Thiobacillus sp. SCUT-2]WRS38767.1 acyloxyacyl hydrolase [Thiobacillus sp. SCUT-2]
MDRLRLPAPSARAGLAAASLVLGCGLAAPALADASARDKEFTVIAGADGDYERAGLSLRFAPVWTDTWGRWRADVRPELELSHLRYTGSQAGPDTLNLGGAIARLHLAHGEGRIRPYVEGGLGVALFSRDRLGGKGFSTDFQFSEHVGFGAELTGRGFLGLQYSHYSNADIEKPNDGLDLVQVVLGARF